MFSAHCSHSYRAPLCGICTLKKYIWFRTCLNVKLNILWWMAWFAKQEINCLETIHILRFNLDYYQYIDRRFLWWMQTALQHQIVENLYRLLQLFADCRNYRRKNILLSRRFESRFTRHGTDSANRSTNRCTRYRPIVWSPLERSRQRSESTMRAAEMHSIFYSTSNRQFHLIFAFYYETWNRIGVKMIEV